MTRRAVLYTALTLAVIAVLSMDARAEEPKSAPVVNINTATETELQFLPGIGPKMASAINDYKEACCDHADGAAFKSVDDLVKVKGIKAAKLAKLRPYVVVTGPTTATAKIRKDGVK